MVNILTFRHLAFRFFSARIRKETARIYDEPLIRLFERACERYPDYTAIIYIGEKFSYKRLKEPIDRCATALYDLGG